MALRKKRPVMPCGISAQQHDRQRQHGDLADHRRVGERHELVDHAEERRARQCAGDHRGAAGDDGDEGLRDVCAADEGSSPVSGASTPPASPDSAAPTVNVSM